MHDINLGMIEMNGVSDSICVHVSVSASLSVPEQHLAVKMKPVQPHPSDVIEINVKHEGLAYCEMLGRIQGWYLVLM